MLSNCQQKQKIPKGVNITEKQLIQALAEQNFLIVRFISVCFHHCFYISITSDPRVALRMGREEPYNHRCVFLDVKRFRLEGIFKDYSIPVMDGDIFHFHQSVYSASVCSCLRLGLSVVPPVCATCLFRFKYSADSSNEARGASLLHHHSTHLEQPLPKSSFTLRCSSGFYYKSL